MLQQSPHRQKGFTLLEIIIAMAIAALIGVAAMQLLDSATVSHKNIKLKGDRFNQIERAFLFISNDLQQVAPRRFRNEFGDKRDNLVSDDANGKTRISFTRLGRRNPAGLPRSNLEKLTYLVDKGALQRITYPYPDGMSEEQGLSRKLLDDVESMKLQFYQGEDWIDFWPPDDLSSQGDVSKSNPLPLAVKFSVELKDLGIIERIFVISDKKSKANAQR